MPPLRLLPVVKKYKSQKLEQGAVQLDAIEFDGSYDQVKQTLWGIVQQHIKGLARITDNVVELDTTVQQIDQISNFVVISKSSRSYTFGDVTAPMYAIHNDLSNIITKRSAVESLTTFIYVYSRNVMKVGDYERVMASITGGAAAADRSGAPNQNQHNTVMARLKQLHPHLEGEDMIWNSWAGILLRNQETLEERIRLPPPSEVTLLFERQTQSEQQLQNVRHSLRIAIELVDDQHNAVEALMRAFEYSYLDLKNLMKEQQRNLKVHKRTIHNVLNAITPIENASAANILEDVDNVDDEDHSVGTVDSEINDELSSEREE